MNTAVLGTRSQPLMQYGLCLLVAALLGSVVLLGLPVAWLFAVVAAVGIVGLMATVKSPERVLLLIVSFSTPFYLGKEFIIRTENFPLANGAGIHLADILSLSLLGVLLARLARRQASFRFFPNMTGPAILWLAASTFSLLAAQDPDASLLQLVHMGRLFLLYLLVANTIRSARDIQWLIAGLMGGLLIQALIGVLQAIVGHPLGLTFLGEISAIRQQQLEDSLVYRIQGTIGHANGFAMYITSVAPFALAALFSRARRLYKALAGIVLCAAVLALLFSLSRSAWLNFLLVIAVVPALAIRRKRLGLVGAGLLAAVASAVVFLLLLAGPEFIVLRLTADDQGSATSRITLAQGALDILRDHPVLGIGLNNYPLVSPSYDPVDFLDQGKPPIVHNAFLLIAAETGIVGLSAFLMLLASLVVSAWRIPGQENDDTFWIAGAGLFGAWVALIAHAMVDYDLLGSTQVFAQFWLLAGLCAAVAFRVSPALLQARRLPRAQTHRPAAGGAQPETGAGW